MWCQFTDFCRVAQLIALQCLTTSLATSPPHPAIELAEECFLTLLRLRRGAVVNPDLGSAPEGLPRFRRRDASTRCKGDGRTGYA